MEFAEAQYQLTHNIYSKGMKTMSESPRSSTPSTDWYTRRGNFLYTSDGTSYGYEHGHVALISDFYGNVIEATTTTNSGAKVFHWSYRNLWGP